MRRAVVILVLFACIQGGIAARAGAQGQDPLVTPPTNVTLDVVEGVVSAVNTSCGTISVEREDGTVDLLVKPETEVFLERERVRDLTELPKGYTARAYFRSNGDAARILVVRNEANLPTSTP